MLLNAAKTVLVSHDGAAALCWIVFGIYFILIAKDVEGIDSLFPFIVNLCEWHQLNCLFLKKRDIEFTETPAPKSKQGRPYH